ncbi:putative ribonuclease H-like domain-containing protein [Tanacetum coccineum]|uniref:Ribonuclease H-like domain-containing protein n=1 Tax=Tanacetum coccineum TaxID=301880 RepID=A0ABQ4Z9Z9_9ASTR
MTGNKCYLDEYEDYDGRFVSFDDGKGRISGKGKIKTGSLDFDDVYFCKELKYNLFSMSQICDKKNIVLFTDTECLLLSSNFKLLDEKYSVAESSMKGQLLQVLSYVCCSPLEGIKREFSVARTPQQNGVAKRKNRTLIEAARTMLVDSKLPTIFWAEAVNTACYVLNRVLVIKPHNTTPYELICGRPPLIDFMKPFGCPVTILNTKDHIETLNIRFLENTPNVKGNGPDLFFDVDSLTISMNYVPVVAGKQTNGIAGTKDNIVAGPKDNERDAGMKPTEVDENEASDTSVKHDQAIRSESERLNQWEMQTEHTNNINTVSTPVSTAGPSINIVVPSPLVNTTGPSVSTANAFEEHLFEIFSSFKNAFTLPPVPNVSSMVNTSIFGNAYDDEDVEEEVDMNNVISSYSVPETSFTKFHKDYLVDQVIGSFKTPVQTRHMTKINEEHGIDYDEVFAPVARIEAIRLFLAYASFKDFVVYQMDVKSAFLYEKIEDEVYVCQPPSFEDPHFPDKVYKVEKALCGLHQAPRAWHKDDIILVQVYVDDIIFGSTKKEISIEFEKLMHDKFQMSSMGELSFFLGLQVKQKCDGIFISQDKYVAEILKKFDFASVKTASTLIETNKALIKDEEAEDVDVHLYRSMIGSLIDSLFDLEAFSDSDYAGASLDRKFATGGCQFLGKRLISWQCKKQTVVANSTTEAEYVAAVDRVLVIKPHNKTPYKLIPLVRPPLIDFMKPFGCPVTILNTRDHLGKFDGKVDEGYFVGYFVLFDVDSLTISMNYVPVVVGNQTNGIAETKDNIVTGQAQKEKEPEQEYILIPLYTTNPLISQSPKHCEGDAGMKPTEVDENEALDKSGKHDQATRSESKRLNQIEMQTEHTNSTNIINSVSTLVNTDGPSVSTANAFEEHLFERFSPFKNAFTLPPVLNVSSMDNTGIFGNAYNDEDVEEEVDMNNVVSSYTVPDSSFTKFHKDHPEDQVIGSLKTPVQTRQMTKINKEHGLISSVHKLRRTNHKDFQNCLFACFLSQMEPKKPVKDMWAIGTKWVFRNKKDERGIVVNNKAILVAQGHTQEEGIDYDEVFAPIEEEVYVYQPPGFEDLHFPDKVYKVEKALFGLHQALRACSMGELSFFLGLQVKQKSDGIFISQDKYVAEILKKFDFASVKTASTLMETNKALIKDEEAEDMDVHLYRSMIGSLMYLTASRPDIMFVVCACARFQVTPKASHLHAVKRIFRYLKGQPKLGLWYPRDSPFDLEAFSDSDYAGASLDRKSTTGGCQFLGKRLISWQCKKQTIVANSTTEAEYVAAANCCRQVGDKAVHKELGDKMERAATTASSLKAKQDSDSGPRCQDTILGDVDAQTRFETTSKWFNDPPLLRGYTLGSREDIQVPAAEEKPAESEGFEHIVDFLNANPINMHLLLILRCIQQFWDSAKLRTVNRDVQIQALIDGKKIIVNEASIRRDLKLEDAEGSPCLPNATIFEELTRMGAKTIAWNEFSSTIASAIICLANNQKFIFSKYIFDNMLGDMSHHKKIFVNPFHTKKVFANMKRAGKDFSGRITPLFDTMMVQASEEVGKDSDHPTDSNQIPIVDQPSTSSQPKKKQKYRRKQRKEAEVSQDEIA